uniref:Uncharacterized protein n=1 Tax=Chrysotila carterae TaxID=13221 RepID=A0A7S4ETL8_CHRCT
MVKDEIESASQLSRRVAHEGDQRVALDALVLGPRAHHRAVVHTVHNHLLHPDCLESVRVLKVAWHLHIGSGGCECAGQAQNDEIPARRALRKVDLLWRETEMQVDRWHAVAHAHRRGDGGGREAEAEGEAAHREQ